MLVTLLGITTLVRPVQPANVLSSIILTLSPIINFVNPEQQ